MVWWPWFVNTGLQSLIVSALALVVAALAHRLSAAVRHLVLAIAIVAILVLSLLGLSGRHQSGSVPSVVPRTETPVLYSASQPALRPLAAIRRIGGETKLPVPVPGSPLMAIRQAPHSTWPLGLALWISAVAPALFMVWATVAALLLLQIAVSWLMLSGCDNVATR